MEPTQEVEADGSERRTATRMRTLKRAKIITNRGFSTFDSIVRNISATGALLTIDETVHLPKDFRIKIGDETDDRPASLVYRRGLLAGIRFLDAQDGEPAAGSLDPERRDMSVGDGDTNPSQDGIRRLVPESFPPGLTRHFPWPQR